MRVILTILVLIVASCSAQKNHQEKDTFLNFGDAQIHYKISGKGQEMIMVHGGYLDLNMWQPQIGEFRNDKRIVRFSDIGHGKSKSNNNQIYGHEIIVKLSQATEKNPAIIMGLSWGAMLCVDYALKHPNKVDKLILVSPGLSGWNYFKDTLAAKNNKLRRIAIENNNIEQAAILFHQNWVVGPRRDKSDLEPQFYEESLEMITTNMRDHWKEDWSKLDSIPAIKRLKQITVPTYIIIGDQDADDIKSIAEEYDEKVPKSTKFVIENAAHLVNMEKPAAFNRLLKQLLEE